jgi:hypothetical protein
MRKEQVEEVALILLEEVVEDHQDQTQKENQLIQFLLLLKRQLIQLILIFLLFL